jgi:Prp8 binding protein
VKRTSGLQAPIMQLAGHGAEVLTARFDPSGAFIASAAADKCIFMWRTYGECENYMMLRGHKSAVLELSWFQDGARLVSCSADKTIRGWDVEVGQQIKRLNEHTAVVNSVSTLRRGAPLFVSGGDDNTIKVGAGGQRAGGGGGRELRAGRAAAGCRGQRGRGAAASLPRGTPRRQLS